MKLKLTAVIIAAGAALAVLGPAPADDYYDIVLANRVVARLRDPGPAGDLATRGCRVDQNVTEALSVEEVGSPRMSLQTVGGLPAIFIGRTFLVQVRPGDARGTGRSAASLARQWLGAFRQQFPRAEPVTKMGATTTTRVAVLGAAGERPAAKPVVVPDEDRALVGEVERLFCDARLMEDADFEARSGALATELAGMVWGQSSGGGSLEGLSGSEKAVYSALNGLRYAREAGAGTYEAQKALIALTVVKRVRAAMASTGPAPAGPVEALAAPASAG